MNKESNTELYLVRHGETEWNLQKRFQGQMNSALTSNGIRQAEQLGEFLREIVFDVIYTSDLGRALETAVIINQKLKVPRLIKDPLLRERNFGIFHGMTREEAEKKFPEDGNRIWSGKASEGIPEGESRMEVRERALAFLAKAASIHKGERILAISHGGIVNALIREVMQISPDSPRRFKLPNTGLQIFIYEKDSWFLKAMGILAQPGNYAVYDQTI